MSDRDDFEKWYSALPAPYKEDFMNNPALGEWAAKGFNAGYQKAVEHCNQGDKVAEMRNALEAVSGMFWVEQTTKNEIYESSHYPGPNKFNRQSLEKHISQLLRELDGEIFENNILATPQPSTDVSELKGKLDIAIEALRALNDNGNARIALDAIAKHTVNANDENKTSA